MPELDILTTFDDLLSYLKEKNKSFRRVENETTVMVASPSASHPEQICYLRWEPIPGVIQFIQMLPLTVPEEKRAEMAILLNQINFDLVIAGFGMNEKNGVLTYRVQTLLDQNHAIAAEMISVHIRLTLQMMEALLPKLRAVAEPEEDRGPLPPSV